MIELKSPGEIEAMAAAGRVVSAVHDEVRARADVGVSLRRLDTIARDVIASHGGKPSFLGYHPHFAPTPYPGVINTSVNEVMLHGIPTPYRLRNGDLISIDCGVHVDGWHADGAVSFVVGTPASEDLALIETAKRALAAGIHAAQPGARLGDVATAISSTVRAAGYGMQRDFAGHGIGRAMHEDPFVPNEGRAGRGLRLVPGLVIAIEPSLMAGGNDDYLIADDGWSIVTGDGSRSAHVEHSVAVTADGPVILTSGDEAK